MLVDTRKTLTGIKSIFLYVGIVGAALLANLAAITPAEAASTLTAQNIARPSENTSYGTSYYAGDQVRLTWSLDATALANGNCELNQESNYFGNATLRTGLGASGSHTIVPPSVTSGAPRSIRYRVSCAWGDGYTDIAQIAYCIGSYPNARFYTGGDGNARTANLIWTTYLLWDSNNGSISSIQQGTNNGLDPDGAGGYPWTCGMVCNTGYTATGGSYANACQPFCSGTTPFNATACSGDSTGLSGPAAKTVAAACTTGTKCEYTCNAGYYASGGVCVPYACTGATPNWATLCYNDDAGLTSNSARTVVNACGAAKCEYQCDSGRHSSGGACVQDAACGSARNGTFTTPPTSNLCSPGTASAVTGVNSYSWTCTSGATQVSCSATGPAAVAGSCGTNRTNYVATASAWPSTNATAFCSAGTLSGGTPAFPSTGGSQTWTCGGLNGGGSTSCTATRSLPTPTATISAPDCTITAGNSSCTSSVTWSSANFTGATSIRQEGSQFSTNGSSGGTSRTIPYGSVETFTVFDGSTQRATDDANALCASGTGWSGSACVTAPGTPTGLSAAPATCGTGQITLTWNSVSGATGYDLQIDGVWQNVGGISYTHNGLVAGSFHTYRVRAWNNGGGAGAQSGQVSATAPVACVYSCTGSTPANASLCAGDSASLTADTGRTLVNSCSASTKCEYTCSSGYNNSGGTCVQNASCGSSAGGGFATAPTSNLCTVGAASSVTGSYSWSCTSGTSVIGCSAGLPSAVAASCGSNRTNYTSSVSAWPSTNASAFCSSGTLVGATPAFPAAGSNVSWTCNGLYGGVSASCTATRSLPTPTASISAPNCTITAGNSSCTSSVTWSSANFTGATSIRQEGSQFSTNASSGGTSRTIPYGSVETFTVFDGSTQRAADDASASCASGTSWNGSTCAATPPTPTASISAPNCAIAVGGSSCSVSVNWSSANFTGPVSVREDSNQFSTNASSAGTSRTLPYGSHVYSIHDGGTVRASDAAIAACTTGSGWNGSTCVLPPAAPTGLIATPGVCDTGRIDLTWNAASGAAGYNIQIDGGVWQSINNVLSYAHTGQSAGSAHTYRVQAWNVGGGAGAASASVSATTPAGCVPKDLSAQSNTPAAGTSIAAGSAIAFTGVASNISADAIAEGGWADLEIDWNSDGSYTNYNAFGGAQLGAFSSSQTKTLSYTLAAGNAPAGTHRYRFNVDVTNIVAESDEVNNQSAWTTFSVAAAPTVSLTATGCNSIPVGGSTCNGQVSWSFSNVSAPENYQVENTTTGTVIGSSVSGNNVQITLPYGVNQIEASANGVSDDKEANAYCVPAATWNAATSRCEVAATPPSITMAASPNLVRRGRTTEVAITINSPQLLNCTLYSATGVNQSFVHDGTVTPSNTYRYPTSALQSARIVMVRCSYGAGQTTSAEVRINVLPTVQEI